MAEISLEKILESVLFAAEQPLSINELQKLFPEDQSPSKAEIKQALLALQESYLDRAIELKQVASGFRFQVRATYADWVSLLKAEKPPRYSRALLETLALIAYRQPITRGEIEDIRGVAVSHSIMKTLEERNWVKIIGHREVPGKPALYATTKEFLDYFNLSNLRDLPNIKDLARQAEEKTENKPAEPEQKELELKSEPELEQQLEPEDANS